MVLLSHMVAYKIKQTMYRYHSIYNILNESHYLLLSQHAPFLNSVNSQRMSEKIKPEWNCSGQLQRNISNDLDHASQIMFCGSLVVKNISEFPETVVGEGNEKFFSKEKCLTLYFPYIFYNENPSFPKNNTQDEYSIEIRTF